MVIVTPTHYPRTSCPVFGHMRAREFKSITVVRRTKWYRGKIVDYDSKILKHNIKVILFESDDIAYAFQRAYAIPNQYDDGDVRWYKLIYKAFR